MPRNTNLAKVLQLLKGELGLAQTPGVAPYTDVELCVLLENRQRLLASQYDWPFLDLEEDIDIVASVRYYDMPTTFNEDRPMKVVCLYNDVWREVCKGIGAEQYNSLSSGDGGVSVQPQDPIMRWRLRPGDPEQFEVWPVPTVAQTVRFSGQRQPATLRHIPVQDFSFNYTSEFELDDLLVVLYVAAEKMGPKNQELAKLKLALAEERLAKLRGSATINDDMVVLGQARERRPYRYIKPRTS